MSIRVYPLCDNNWQIYQQLEKDKSYTAIYSGLTVTDQESFILGPIDVKSYKDKSIVIKVTGNQKVMAQIFFGPDADNLIPYSQIVTLDELSKNGMFFNIYASYFAIKAKCDIGLSSALDISLMAVK